MIQAKKSLGQNFLKSDKALREIIEAGDIKPSDTVIEIGPGEGALTLEILKKLEADTSDQNKSTATGKLIVIEKDDRLIPILENKYSDYIEKGHLQIIHADILDTLEEDTKSNPKHNIQHILKGISSYKIIANIPYYITGILIRRIFEQEVLPERVVLLVQKEVADRIVARGKTGERDAQGLEEGGKESLLSLSVKLYGIPRRVSVVPKGAFAPAPTVDSAILSITNIQKRLTKQQEESFFQLIKAGFGHKRKRLAKNLADLNIQNKKLKEWESILERNNLDKNVRAEDVSLGQYLNLI
jgi:16S rRNA (adenine1518-N6/adenine1519-N6)-dimethyltransferase